MNISILKGRLTKDPEVRYNPEKGMVEYVKFNLAVDRPVKRGEEKKADFPRITMFGKQAENCEKYLAKGWLVKGRLVLIQGKIQTGSYQDKDGKTVYTTDIIGDKIDILEWGDRQPSQSTETPNPAPAVQGEQEVFIPEFSQTISADDEF